MKNKIARALGVTVLFLAPLLASPGFAQTQLPQIKCKAMALEIDETGGPVQKGKSAEMKPELREILGVQFIDYKAQINGNKFFLQVLASSGSASMIIYSPKNKLNVKGSTTIAAIEAKQTDLQVSNDVEAFYDFRIFCEKK